MKQQGQTQQATAQRLVTGAVHHFVLTVSDRERARTFYSQVLGFDEVIEFGPNIVLSNGSVILGLHHAPDPDRAIPGDEFDENRVGLDHLSLTVQDRDALEQAVQFFGERRIPCGDIKDLGSDLGIYVLALRDPDNIQIELTAPYS